MRHCKLIVTLLILFMLLWIAFKYTRAPKANLTYIQNEINQRVKRGYNRHIVACWVNKGKVHSVSAGDWSFLPPGSSPELALFEVASVTKAFTYHLIILLEDEGLLKLDEPIQNYLPNSVQIPKFENKSITLNHLLTHTSGLKDPPPKAKENLGRNKVVIADFSINDLYDYLNNSRLEYSPGSHIEYSNLGYGLAVHIAEKKANKSFEELLREKILIPLKMQHTFINVPESSRGLLVQGSENGQLVPPWDIKALKGFGSLISCAKDLSTYVLYLFYQNHHPKLISPGLEVDLIKTGETSTTYGSENEFSLIKGWSHDKRYEGSLYVSSGVSTGCTAFLGYNPKTKQAVILLTDSSSLDFLGHHWLNSKFPLSKLYSSVYLNHSKLLEYEGVYETLLDDLPYFCKIKALESCLELTTDDEPALYLYPISSTKFATKYFHSSHGVITFSKQGESEYFKLELTNGALIFKKKKHEKVLENDR